MFLISYGIGWLLGWSLMDSLFLGAALASSSTVIIAKALTDLGKLKDTSSLIMMGILVAEDIFVVLILALITSIAGSDTLTVPGIAWTAGKVLLFIFGTLIIGSFIIPERSTDGGYKPGRTPDFNRTGTLLRSVGNSKPDRPVHGDRSIPYGRYGRQR